MSRNIWLLANDSVSLSNSNEFYLVKHNSFFFYTEKEKNERVQDVALSVHSEGHIFPRFDVPSAPSQEELIITLYQQYGKDFIRKVKGNFTIIIIDGDRFNIFSDRFGIKKYFYWTDGNEFIISNDLKSITSNITAKPSPDNMAIYALTYHFVGGKTIFENIYYNRPAEIIEFKNGKLSHSTYWDASELLKIEKRVVNTGEIAEALTKSVEQHLYICKSNTVSHSLTAGVDSRILFSILLNQKLKIHTYTYGDPNSVDCKIASKISEKYGVSHTIHDIRFDKDSFAQYAKNSISTGQSLVSLHRAHRLKAMESEARFADTMFLGTMGGEFIKGANRTDYIISDFVYEFSQQPSRDVLIRYLSLKGVKLENLDIEYLMQFFKELNWNKHPDLVDLYGLIEIAASLHHAQNNIQYENYFKNIFTPYLDIDYLEVLFQSDYIFLHKKKFSTKFQRRLENHRFAADLQYILNADLAKMPYNSGFVPKEYKLNRYYAALKARIRKRLWNYEANFPLGDWMNQFVNENLKNLQSEKNIINDIFDLDDLSLSLQKSKIIPTESFWLKYTTPIQMNYLLKLF